MAWLVPLILYVVVIVVFFAVKLNHGKVVESAAPAHEEIEAIDFYWRPG